MTHLIDRFQWTDAVDILVVALLLYWIMVLIKGTRAGPDPHRARRSLRPLLRSPRGGARDPPLAARQLPGPHPPDRGRPVPERDPPGAGRGRPEPVLLRDQPRRGIAAPGGGRPRVRGALPEPGSGALIGPVERRTGLRDFIEGGVPIDSRVTSALVRSIFEPSSPIHDGALVVSRGRLAAAGCFLPMTDPDRREPEPGGPPPGGARALRELRRDRGGGVGGERGPWPSWSTGRSRRSRTPRPSASGSRN